ncbi:MAG: hypothetical protein U1D06_11075 [Paracoccaceae bacterium]|nr:hypothetical protein [Paracoccaceae bacterium]
MNRTLALAHPFIAATGRIDPVNLARSMIVLVCAASLILAG